MIRVLSMVEGKSVTGPIKPLMMFAKACRGESLVEYQLDLSVATTIRPNIKNQQSMENDLVRAMRLAGIRLDLLVEKRAWDPAVIRQLVTVVLERKPDLIETHQVKCHFILAQALYWGLLKKNFRWVAYHHGYTSESLKISFYESLDRWSLPRADHVVTVCRPFAETLIKRGVQREHLSVFTNAVEEGDVIHQQRIEDLRQSIHALPDDFLILSVGRLSVEKGHIDLMKAIPKLLNSLPVQVHRRIHFIFVGDGPEKALLESQKINDHRCKVTFVGHQLDVNPYYRAADVFVMPSHTEGSPLALLEAMSVGLPIVATNVGGIPELVAHNVSALLVPHRDESALSAALHRVIVDKEIRIRLGASAKLGVRKFDSTSYSKRVLEMYGRVLGRA